MVGNNQVVLQLVVLCSGGVHQWLRVSLIEARGRGDRLDEYSCLLDDHDDQLYGRIFCRRYFLSNLISYRCLALGSWHVVWLAIERIELT